MKEKVTRYFDNKWDSTYIRDTKTGAFAAFNNQKQAVFGKGDNLKLYSPKLENGKRECLGPSFLNRGLLK